MGLVNEIRILSGMIAQGGLVITTQQPEDGPDKIKPGPCMIRSLIQADADIITQIHEAALTSPEILTHHSDKLQNLLSLINSFNRRLLVFNRSALAGTVLGIGLGVFHSPAWLWVLVPAGLGPILIRTCIVEWLHLKIKKEMQTFNSGNSDNTG